MFTISSRTSLRDRLVDTARADPGVVAAALVGSAATGREDAWSDIDLMLRLAVDADSGDVVERWTETMYAEHDARHHLDVVADGSLFRVFLLADSLQVDLSFWPYERFRATQPGFSLIFGASNTPTSPNRPEPGRLIGLGWLHALYARSAIARGRVLQAAMMLDGVRDHVLDLACVRHGLNGWQGREAHLLPADEFERITSMRAAQHDLAELLRAHKLSVDALLAEARQHEPAVAERLAVPLRHLALPGATVEAHPE